MLDLGLSLTSVAVLGRSSGGSEPIILHEDVVAFAAANSTPLDAQIRLNEAYEATLAIRPREDILFMVWSTDFTPGGGSTLATLGGWTSNSVALTGSPPLKQAGLEFGPGHNSTRRAQITVPGMQSCGDLLVISHATPLYNSGSTGSSAHARFHFGRSSGNRQILLGQTTGSSPTVITVSNGTARTRTIPAATRSWDSDQTLISAVHFHNQRLRMFDGTTQVGDWTDGDYSPAGTGHTLNDTWRIAHGLSGTDQPTSFFTGQMGFQILLRGVGYDAQPAINALMPKFAGLIRIPTPPVWKVALGGIEDASGDYANGSLWLAGCDTSVAAINKIHEINLSTGRVIQLAATLSNARFKCGAARRALDGCIYLYGGRNSYLSQLYGVVERLNPATRTVTTLPETIPVTAEPGVAHDPQQDVTYIFGGMLLHGNSEYRDTILRHNHAAGTFTTLTAKLPWGLIAHAAIYVPGKGTGGAGAIYIFGGFRDSSYATATDVTPNGRTVDFIQKFDCGTETITTLSNRLPYIRDSTYGAWVPSQNKIYLFGGYDSDGSAVVAPKIGYLDSIVVFDVATETASNLAGVVLPRAADDFMVGMDEDENIWLGTLPPPGVPANYIRSQKYFAKFVPSVPSLTLQVNS